MVMDINYNLNQMCIVMDYMPNDLDMLLYNQIPFTENHLIKLVYNSLASISFTHQANIVHRDLKSANILISS